MVPLELRSVWRNVGGLGRRRFYSKTTSDPVWIQWKRTDGSFSTCPVLSQHHTDQASTVSMDPVVEEAVLVNDATRASDAARFIREGNYLLYEGDYHNARQLLKALKQRFRGKPSKQQQQQTILEQWKRQRESIRSQTRRLNRLLIKVEDHSLVALRRAPDVTHLLKKSSSESSYAMSLRELLGRIGSHEWEKQGVCLLQLMGRTLHPHFGVFSPTRHEYLDLILAQQAGGAGNKTVMDVGTGTGVIAALMLLNGKADCVIGTDNNPRAIACARENLERLDLMEKTQLVECHIFPPHPCKVDLIICNPPWIPGDEPDASLLDRAVYDTNGFLPLFLHTAQDYLRDDVSEVWLVLSDLAERLGLREEGDVERMARDGNLEIVHVSCTAPRHPKARGKKKSRDNEHDKVAAARSLEVTKLYRMRRRKTP